MERNSNGHYRGLHVVIINSKTGQVHMARVFDTYKTSVQLDDIINNEIPPFCIVAAACKDACHENLSEEVMQWFESMGAKEIRNIEHRSSYAFIGEIH